MGGLTRQSSRLTKRSSDDKRSGFFKQRTKSGDHFEVDGSEARSKESNNNELAQFFYEEEQKSDYEEDTDVMELH